MIQLSFYSKAIEIYTNAYKCLNKRNANRSPEFQKKINYLTSNCYSPNINFDQFMDKNDVNCKNSNELRKKEKPNHLKKDSIKSPTSSFANNSNNKQNFTRNAQRSSLNSMSSYTLKKITFPRELSKSISVNELYTIKTDEISNTKRMNALSFNQEIINQPEKINIHMSRDVKQHINYNRDLFYNETEL